MRDSKLLNLLQKMDPSNPNLHPRTTTTMVSTKSPHITKPNFPSTLQTLTSFLKPRPQSSDEELLLQHAQPQPRSRPVSTSPRRAKPVPYRPSPSTSPQPEPGLEQDKTGNRGENKREKLRAYMPTRGTTLVEEIARREAERSRSPTSNSSSFTGEPTPAQTAEQRKKPVPIAKIPTGSPTPTTSLLTRASGSIQRGSHSVSPKKAGYVELDDHLNEQVGAESRLRKVDRKEVGRKGYVDDKTSTKSINDASKPKPRKSVRFSDRENVRYVRDDQGREEDE